LLNGIWLGLMLTSVVYAAFTGRMDAVKMAAVSGAKDAVDLVIGLVGVMALFLGLMRVAQEGGLLCSAAWRRSCAGSSPTFPPTIRRWAR
jgi:spore maturation protein A